MSAPDRHLVFENIHCSPTWGRLGNIQFCPWSLSGTSLLRMTTIMQFRCKGKLLCSAAINSPKGLSKVVTKIVYLIARQAVCPSPPQNRWNCKDGSLPHHQSGTWPGAQVTDNHPTMEAGILAWHFTSDLEKVSQHVSRADKLLRCKYKTLFMHLSQGIRIRLTLTDCAPGENSLLWPWQNLAFCWLLRQLWNRVKLYEFARKITRAVAQHWAMQEGNFQFYVSIKPVLRVTQENNEPGKIHLLGPDICFLLPSGLQISCLFRQILKQYNCKGCASSMIHHCQVSLGISLKSVPFLLIFSLWSYESPSKLEFSISSAFPVSHQHLLLRFLRFWLAYHAQP